VASAFGWGHEGHEAIADVALKHLSIKASAAVSTILASQEIQEVTTLAGAATWPDDIKDGQPPFQGKFRNTTAAQNFKGRFPDHTKWHFVNYPLEGPSYSLTGAFSKPNDIVHQINLCIDVLESPPGGVLNKSEALAFLVHLVGDLHQPLHVACGYYTLDGQNVATLVKNPQAPHDARHERGGNGLHFMIGSTEHNLHSFWDVDLVSANGSAEGTLVKRLDSNLAVLNLSSDSGAVRGWAPIWLDDSMAKADAVYFDATGGVGTPGTDSDDPAQGTVVIDIPIHVPTYKLNHKQDAKDQMTKGAFHLAELLNNIQWNP
jgi:S1/P1 nuclease